MPERITETTAPGVPAASPDSSEMTGTHAVAEIVSLPMISTPEIAPPPPRRRRRRRTPTSLKTIEAQLQELRHRTVGYVEARHADSPRGRHDDCFLTWPAGARVDVPAVTLGPYSRWLIGARLIMLESAPEALLSEELGMAAARTDRVFATDGPVNTLISEASRFRAPEHDDPIGGVLLKILERLDEKYQQARGSPLTVEAFLDEPVPLTQRSKTVGEECIAWFDQWVRLGVGTPRKLKRNEAPRYNKKHQRKRPKSDQVAEVLALLSSPESTLAHRRIVNVSASRLDVPMSDFVRDVVEGLSSIRTVYLRLSARDSRRSVLELLYRTFNVPLERLKALKRRPIDLSIDLEPVRIALTANRVVLIFDGWDNVAGTFRSLHSYLCNTHWAEFIRVLAQPDLTTWERAPVDASRLQYALLVLSTNPVVELDPWVRFIPHSKQPSPRKSHDLDASAPEVPSVSSITALERLIKDKDDDVRQSASRQLVKILSLRLIAASVNGVRRSTLKRCIDYWADQFWPADAKPILPADRDFAALIRELRKTHGLILGDDDEVEGLSADWRGLELNRRPCPASAKERVLTFASLERRATFVRHWLETEPPVKHSDDASTMSLPTCSWAHVNFLLAQECLRHGTSQLKHLYGDGVESAYAVRRMGQVIYHGLMSLDLTSEDFGAAKRSVLGGSMLPEDVTTRYKVLYGSLYRNVVETGTWKLGRGFGRADLRIDLLTLFVYPALGSRMLTDVAGAGPSRPLLEYALQNEIAAPLQEDPAILSELLLALGRSGCELGGTRGADAARWALKMLPGGKSMGRGPLLSRDNVAYQHHATRALKLRIDWLMWGVRRKTRDQAFARAETLCLAELSRLRVDGALLANLHDVVRQTFELYLPDPSEGRRPPDDAHVAFEDALQSTLATLKNRIPASAFEQETASAMLFRYGEILAMKIPSDAGSADPPLTPLKREQIIACGYACAIFWVADNLRLEAGLLGDTHVEWPLATARSMRQYIRMTLKLAQMLTEASEGKWLGLRMLTTRLMEHAQNRLDVHSRHHFTRRIQRASMLLLEIFRVRAWVRIEVIWEKYREKQNAQASSHRSRAGRTTFLETKQLRMENNDRHRELLNGAWDQLKEAEEHLLSLGHQLLYVRRLYLERIKTVIAMATLTLEYHEISPSQGPDGRVTRLLDLAAELLDVLEVAGARSPFWLAVVERQRKNLDEVKSDWDEVTVPAK